MGVHGDGEWTEVLNLQDPECLRHPKVEPMDLTDIAYCPGTEGGRTTGHCEVHASAILQSGCGPGAHPALADDSSHTALENDLRRQVIKSGRCRWTCRDDMPARTVLPYKRSTMEYHATGKIHGKGFPSIQCFDYTSMGPVPRRHDCT
jgi:hypothetical protein